MQAQSDLGAPEKLDVKEKTSKSEALIKEAGVEVLSAEAQEAMQQCCLPSWHALGCDACVFPLVARTPLSGTVKATS